jgi:hypothetical protein
MFCGILILNVGEKGYAVNESIKRVKIIRIRLGLVMIYLVDCRYLYIYIDMILTLTNNYYIHY